MLKFFRVVVYKENFFNKLRKSPASKAGGAYLKFSGSALLLRKSPAKPVRIYLCGAMSKLPLNLELLAIPLVMSYGVTRQRRV